MPKNEEGVKCQGPRRVGKQESLQEGTIVLVKLLLCTIACWIRFFFYQRGIKTKNFILLKNIFPIDIFPNYPFFSFVYLKIVRSINPRIKIAFFQYSESNAIFSDKKKRTLAHGKSSHGLNICPLGFKIWEDVVHQQTRNVTPLLVQKNNAVCRIRTCACLAHKISSPTP